MAYQKRYGGQKKSFNPNWKKKGEEVVPGSQYKPIRNPTGEQVAIIDHVTNSNKSLVGFALAGCSKTSTMVEAMYACSRDQKICYRVFNNRNVREAEAKCPPWVDVATSHAYSLRALKSAFGKIEVDAKGQKADAIATAIIGSDDNRIELRSNFCKVMRLCKASLCESVEQVQDVMIEHEIESPGMNETEFAAKVLEGMETSAQQFRRVDFDDMQYLCIKLNVQLPKYDIVIIDEGQDQSPCSLEIAYRSVGQKMIAVLDQNQRIYGFTAAHKNAMEDITNRMQADLLPLNTTFRCAKAIVEHVQFVVPEYRAHESNPEGAVNEIGQQQMIKLVRPGDFIISRVNAPLLGIVLNLVKNGQKASILGKDLGRSLTFMLKRSKAKSVVMFLDWLENWERVECERLATKNRSCEFITDKADCLRVFCEGETDLDKVRFNIEDMFDDESDYAGRVVAMSGHRSKGLEADRVFLLGDTFKPDRSLDEKRVYYVAATRAKTELNIVR